MSKGPAKRKEKRHDKLNHSSDARYRSKPFISSCETLGRSHDGNHAPVGLDRPGRNKGCHAGLDSPHANAWTDEMSLSQKLKLPRRGFIFPSAGASAMGGERDGFRY